MFTMNNTADDKLKALQDMNAKLKGFNALIEDLALSLKADKLKALQDMNSEFSQFNTLLTDLSESLKKDSAASRLHQATP